MTLVSLVYVSIESHPMTESDLTDILAKAREKNQRLDITGMLLYRDGYFIQALEGEEDKVTDLYNTIAKDDRHQKVLMVGKDPIDERSFDEWAMGFKDLNGVDVTKLDGYTDFLEGDFQTMQLDEQPSRAKQLLNLFRTGANY